MEFYEAEFHLGRKLLGIGNRIQAYRSADLLRQGLTETQSEVLLFLDAHPGASPMELKQHMAISHQAARKLAERLGIKGMVRQEADPNDGRKCRLFLTERGAEVCTGRKYTGGAISRRIFKDLAPKELAELDRLLDRVAETLEDMEG